MKYDDPDLQDMLAAEYALGTLTGAARRRFERLMAADPAVGRLVEAWEQRLNALGGALPPVEPPPELKLAIERRIADEPIQGGFALRGDEGDWTAFAAGVDRKILKANTDGSSSALYRLAPGGVLDIHEHDLEEECYVAEGEIEVGGANFRAGDYIFVRRGGAHGVVRTRTGALLFIRGEA